MGSKIMCRSLVLGLMVCAVSVSKAAPKGTVFTYQGRLIDANQPADGEYDFQFKLFDSIGWVQLGTIDINEVDVIDGYFTVKLDFVNVPNVFNGEVRWLEIGVRPGDSNDHNAFVTLSPRQELTPTPYAIYATAAGGVRLGDVSTCNVNTKGTLRYNSGEVQYCDGTIWKTLGSTTPIIWSGGCSAHGRAAGWNLYCNNRVDFNTASAYISANGTGIFTFLKSGYYRVNFWCISCATSWVHIKFLKNGSPFVQTHEHSNNMWTDNFADQIWPFSAGDSLQIQVYNSGGCNYAYHSWSSSGAHSRVQISYEGPLN